MSIKLIALIFVLWIPSADSQAGVPMTSSDQMTVNKQAIQTLFEKVMNQGKADELAGIWPDHQTFLSALKQLRSSFPDIHYSVKDQVAEGDKVAVFWTWTGTSLNPYKHPTGIFQPTGKKTSNDGMAIFEFKNGKISASSLLTDRLGFLN